MCGDDLAVKVINGCAGDDGCVSDDGGVGDDMAV